MRTEEIEELLLFAGLNFWLDTTWKPSYQAQWSGESMTAWTWNTIKYNAPSSGCTDISTYLLLASSEITCHLIITYQKILYSVAQHNIFELALTPDDEDSSHSFGDIKLQTIQIYLNASTCKEWNKYLNETDLRKYQLNNCCTSGLWNCPSH